jgi:hypothetical protein
VIAGSRSSAAIGQWAADAGAEVLAGRARPAARGPAEESTFQRAFALVSPDVLDQVLGAWLWTRAVRVSGQLVIAVDGKAVRGARDMDGRPTPGRGAGARHRRGSRAGGGDREVERIPAVRGLLKMFASPSGAAITIDALHTHSEHRSGHHWPGRGLRMTVKGNMPTLYRQLKKLPWARIPAVYSVSTSCGRRARRTIKAVLAPAWIGFAGAAQVAQVRRTVTKKGKKTVGRLSHHQRLRCRPGHPGRLDPRPPGDQEQAPLGPRHHLPGRQVPGQDRKRAPRQGVAAQPGHQVPAHGRPRQRRRRQPSSRPRPAAHAHAASDRMNDFAVSLEGKPGLHRPRRGKQRVQPKS